MKIGGIVLGVFVTLMILLYGVYKSSIGEKFIYSMIKEKAKILNGFHLSYLKYNINSFSLIAQKGSNKIYLYGDLYPFNGVYEAYLNNLEEIDNNLRGALTSKGSFQYNSFLNITGNAVFAQGYSTLRFQCTDKCFGVLNGNDFNASTLLYMLKVNIPHFKINGKSNVGVVIKKAQTNANFKFLGDVKYKEILLKDIMINGFVNLKNRREYNVSISAKNPDVSAKIIFEKRYKKYLAKGNVNINLSILRPFTYYPLRGRESFDIGYDSQGVFKFWNKNIKGIYSADSLSININSMPAKKLFEITGINAFFKGKVNGSVTADGTREFNFLVSNALLLHNRLYKFIQNYTNEKCDKFDVLLIKGAFDNNKAVFNLLGKNQKKNLLISIQNGVYFYNGYARFKIEVVAGENKYVFNVAGDKISVVKIIKNKTSKQEVLVY